MGRFELQGLARFGLPCGPILNMAKTCGPFWPGPFWYRPLSQYLSVSINSDATLRSMTSRSTVTRPVGRDVAKDYRGETHPLPLELFVYLRLIIGILSLRTFAHLTLLSLSNPTLNVTFSLLPITSSHPHASASDSTFNYWRYINIWLTLTLSILFCVVKSLV